MQNGIPPLTIPATIGELVRLVDGLPEEQIEGLICKISQEIKELSTEAQRAVYLRHLVVLGALVNRALFELHDLPKDAGAIL